MKGAGREWEESAALPDEEAEGEVGENVITIDSLSKQGVVFWKEDILQECTSFRSYGGDWELYICAPNIFLYMPCIFVLVWN